MGAEQLGMGMLGGMLGMFEKDQQNQQQERLMDIQKANQMELNKQMQKIQQENWENTNYSAQREQMEKAGLNVGLMYGGQGGGGMTMSSGSGGSAIGGTPAQAGLSSGMALQMANMQANTEVAKAQANKLNVEADKLKGVDTDYTKTQTESLAQGITNQKAQTKLTEMQTNLAGIEYDLKNASIEDSINIIRNEKIKGDKQIYMMEKQGEILNEEAKNKAKEWDLKLTGMGLENTLTNAKIGLTTEQAKEVTQNVINSIRNTDTNVRNSITNQQNANTMQWESGVRKELQTKGIQIQEENQIIEIMKSFLGMSKGR